MERIEKIHKSEEGEKKGWHMETETVRMAIWKECDSEKKGWMERARQ